MTKKKERKTKEKPEENKIKVKRRPVNKYLKKSNHISTM